MARASQELSALHPDDPRAAPLRKERAALATSLGLIDMVVLPEVCDAFVGSAHSTYSFALHARARLRPFYTGHVGGGCQRAASPEGGLVSLSTQHAHDDLEMCTMVWYTVIHGCLVCRVLGLRARLSPASAACSTDMEA
jgi:hypothetical protein